MTKMLLEVPVEVFPLSIPREMSNADFESLCFANPDFVIEREADGKITIMSPVSLVSGRRESLLIAVLTYYALEHGGTAFSSSTGFTLPDTSVKSPDACYVSQEKMSKLTQEDQEHFTAVVPEFIVEIKSPSDRLKDLETKMRDSWIENGVQLAWLIDVDNDRLWIYRTDRSVELVSPINQEITGEDVLPGFTFDLSLLS